MEKAARARSSACSASGSFTTADKPCQLLGVDDTARGEGKEEVGEDGAGDVCAAAAEEGAGATMSLPVDTSMRLEAEELEAIRSKRQRARAGHHCARLWWCSEAVMSSGTGCGRMMQHRRDGGGERRSAEVVAVISASRSEAVHTGRHHI